MVLVSIILIMYLDWFLREISVYFFGKNLDFRSDALFFYEFLDWKTIIARK